MHICQTEEVRRRDPHLQSIAKTTLVHRLMQEADCLKRQVVCAGAQLLAAEKDELAQLVESCPIFAKVTPPQKMAVVAALQAAGHVVGFLGDGNNDALALRKADVGVSVDSGALAPLPFWPLLYKSYTKLLTQSAQCRSLLQPYHAGSSPA